jgi:ATP-binding cassette subfamily B protein
MMRLAKYLRPFLLMLAIAIVLLFVQAMCDLALPSYMSDIVDNGIQQGGVVQAAPNAIRQSTMDRVVIFLSASDKARLLRDYSLINKGSPGAASYLTQYPDLAQEPIYVREAVDAKEMAWLDQAVGKGLLAYNALQQAAANPAKAAALASSLPGGLAFDPSRLPPGTDLFALLARLPATQQSQIVAAVNRQFSTLDANIVSQSAAGLVKAEYTALGVDTSQVQRRYILHTGLIMLLIALLSAVCTVVVSLLSARTAAGLGRDLRRFVFRKVESFSSSEFDKFSTASLITRSTNDVTQIQTVIMIMVRMVVYAPIMGIGGIILAIGKSSSMWWLIAVAVAALIAMVATLWSTAVPRFRVIQNLVDRLNLVSRETLSGTMVIRAFNRQDFELDRFDRTNRDLTGTMLFVNRVMAFMQPGMTLILSGLSLAIIWVGSHQVAASSIQVGDMMAFMQYSIQIVFSFLMLSFMFILVPRASVSAGRIADVLETEPSILDPVEPKRLPEPLKGIVEFDGVAFRYPGAEEDVLHDITFTAWPGQTTALIGATGSGKSTLVNLIPRFYDVTGGTICVDSTDIRTVTQHELRDKIGFVPQKASLFSGTIESNLRYANEEASDETLQLAMDIAQATEFVAATPAGIAEEIAQGGMNVSGGQKQRLSIARALVKEAPIYIFDDSFSAVDFKTDAALRRALKEHTSSSTLLIVTQRVSTVMNADQIIVLDEGRIVGKGAHRELMANCQTYREIASSQLRKEELA